MYATDRTGRQRRVDRMCHGMTLVELMVGMVVALIVGIVAVSSAMMFMAVQRQGIGVGGVTVNVNNAMAAVKNNVAAAGLGFFGDARYLCNTLNLGVGTTAHWNGAAFSPLRITQVGGMDTIDVLQASRVEAGASALLATDTSGADAWIKSYLPAVAGDAVLLAPATSGSPCLVRSVTSFTAAADDAPQRLEFGAGGTHNAATFTTNPSYSDEGGSATLLGQLRWQRFRLNGTQLLMEQPLDGAQAVLARDVMALRAQYGISSGGGSATLQTWQDATGAYATLNAATMATVRAVRLGVVSRSPQRQKPDLNGLCDASTAKPQLFGVEVNPDVSDWTCWRYRTVVVVVPLRNLVLGAAP